MQTIPFTSFTGKDYQPFSSKADVQQLECLYRETIQSGDSENAYVLMKTLGLQQRMVSGACHRGTLQLNDFVFDVVDASILLLDSTFIPLLTYGPIPNDFQPVAMAASFDTLFVISARVLCRINGGVLSFPAAPCIPVAVACIDTYVVLLSLTSQIFWSTDDGLTWNPQHFQTVEANPNQTLAMIVDHNELWIMGNRVTQVYTVGTDANSPFVPRQDAIIQQGIAAARSLVAVADVLLWLGRNKNGERTIVMTKGYQPEDVSTYSENNAMRLMSTVDDCIGMAFQINGHNHVWFTFPKANQTLCYDVDENAWYRCGFWNDGLGKYERHRANTIVSAFGQVLVGDYANGFLYAMSPDYFDDSGMPIRWLRQTPHFTQLNKRVSYSRLEVNAEKGVGVLNRWKNDGSLAPAAFAAALAALVPASVSAAQSVVLTAIYNRTFYDTRVVLPGANVLGALGFYAWGDQPQISMQYSDDGGQTFSIIYSRPLGKMGEYKKRQEWHSLGTAYDRVWRFFGTDPCKICFTGANFDAEVLGATPPAPIAIRSV